MITILFLQFIVSAVTVVFQVLNIPQITTLPFGADVFLSDAVGYWNAFLTDFWPFQIVWFWALVAISVFSVFLILRLVLGSKIQSPTH